MKRSLLSTLVLTLFLTVHPLAAGADAGKGDCPDKGKCLKCAMMEKECKVGQLKAKVKLLKAHGEVLNITEKQLADIKKIKVAAIKDLIQKKANIDVAAVDVKSAVMVPQIDTGAVNKLLDKKYAAKKEYAAAYIKAISDIQQVLTDEQRQAWKEMMIEAEDGDKGCSSKDCPKSKGDKICPITGKPLGDHGKMKGASQ